jgi:hypothetical protein
MSDSKGIAEVIVMPLVVAVVGIAGTYFITRQQEESARTLSQAQLVSTRELAAADHQIKILEIFSAKVMSSNQEERLFALRLLKAMDPDLAEKLATAVREGEPPNSVVGKVAEEVAQDAASRASLSPRIYIHIRSEADRRAAQWLAEQLKARGYLVPGIERLVDFGPASSQLRYFRKTDDVSARQILNALQGLGVNVTLQYTSGFSDRVEPFHYELWFPEGEPRQP